MTEPKQPEFGTLFDWSAAGAVLLGRVCPVVVVVDVLRFTTAVEVGVARGGGGGPAAVDNRSRVAGRVVLAGCLRNASAVGDGGTFAQLS
jgi:phosphosulfolactate phosphohydrolase-like enzyme